MPEVADECDGATWLHGHKFDCSVGNHSADAPVGYTLPQLAGYEHSKLTLRSVVDDATPHDMTLSEFLAGAPTVEHLPAMRHGAPNDLEPVTMRLPPLLASRLRDMAACRGVSLDVLAWSVLLDYVESYP